MILRPKEKASQLFTIRVWPEEITAGHPEWRGKIQHVMSGEIRYFHDWEAMLAFLLSALAPGTQNERRDDHE